MAGQYSHYVSKTTCHRRNIYYITQMYFKARTSMTLVIFFLPGDTIRNISEDVP